MTHKIMILLVALTVLLSACSPSTLGTALSPVDESNSTNSEAVTSDNPPTQIPTNTPEPESACANPYLPVVVGATWTYQGDSPSVGTYSHTQTVTEVTEDGFTEQGQFDELTRTGKWQCTADGLVALQPSNGTEANVTTSNFSATFETLDYSGVTLPKSIAPGDTWTQTLKVHGENDINGMSAQSDADYTYTVTATGIETVTVPVGTFEAMRLDTAISANITATVNGISVPTTLSFSGTQWYAEGVGWIKSTYTATSPSGEVFNSSDELVSYSIP